MWLKRNSASTYDIAFSQGGGGDNQTLHIGFALAIRSFQLYNNDLNVTITGDNNWHHWACTYDNITQEKKSLPGWHLIGEDIASNDFIGTGNTTLYIGDIAYTSNEFDGSIDELRVWTRTLTAAEVQNNFNCEISTQSAWQQPIISTRDDGTNNTSENTLIDATGNNNTGNLQNFALTCSTSNWIAPGAVTSGVFMPCLHDQYSDLAFKAALGCQ